MGKKVIQSLDNDLKGYGNIKGEYDDLSSQLADIATNVKKWGATGGSNDSAAFQAANDYLVSKGGGILYVPAGTWYGNFIIDSNVYVQGAGVSVSIIKSVAGSNQDVVQGRNFLSLTGTAKQTPENRGVRYSGFRNITIDGNRDNNTSGYGIRMWGCSWYWHDVIVQNCANDGIWTEFTSIDNAIGSTSYTQALESNYINIKCINNGNNGWSYNGPHDGNLNNFVAFNNTGYAFKQGTANSTITGSNWNSWLNGNSYYVGTSIRATKVIASAANAGVGIEFYANSGGSRFTDVTVDNCATGIILRGSSVKIDGEMSNNVTAGIVLDGCFRCDVNLVGSNNAIALKVNASGETSINYIKMLMGLSTGQTMVSGTLSHSDFLVLIGNGDVSYTKFNIPTASLDSKNGWTPVLPNSNGTLVATTTGTAAPTGTPTFVGAQFLDTTNKKLYCAFGTTSSSDWVVMN